MTNQHSDSKVSRSSAGVDHYAVNQGVPAGHEDHSVDVVPLTDHSIMEEPVSSTENEINSIPATAMVLGLGAAVCFLLLVVYIVVKVHFCKKEVPKNNKSSTISHVTLKNPPAIISSVHPIDTFNKNWYADEGVPDQTQSEPNFSRVHPIDFCHHSVEPPLTESAPKARLTAAKFLPRY
ncbi:hypothetical protein GHT06_020200 [Daphnia sinensis]|uniref:Uncharacterized protein n=1 Tax=Daphnia sinensis TaxID=1820382 RepID=A0AAD5L432_9CRUS|nr:hypothetical protein GHT06_020195 [Daphnia sinensis]KAI9554920.1 hypothetical protein GHT06_020200 [Daphnia sinensis]